MVKTTLGQTLATLSLYLIASSPLYGTEFKVVMPDTFKPYTYQENGSWVGIDLEINKELLKRMGKQPVYESVPWTRQLAYAERGLTASILTVYCEDKKPFLENSSESFYDVRISLFAHKKKESFAGIDSLSKIPKGSTVGVIRENFFAETLNEHPQIDSSFVHRTSLLAEQLHFGRVDFVLEEYLPFMFYAKEKGYANDFVEVMVLQQNSVCTAFSKPFFGEQSTAIADQAGSIIKQMKQEGYIDKIIERYTK